MSGLRSMLSSCMHHLGGPRKKSKTVRRDRRPVRWNALLEALEPRELLTVFHPAHLAFNTADGIQPLGTAGPSGYTPAQVRHGYGFDRITFNGVVGDGSGQTIAIVNAFDNPNIANDLHQFDLQFGLPDPIFTKVNQRGGTTPPAADAGWAAEIALDVEWAHAIAPRANILLVEADNNSPTHQ